MSALAERLTMFNPNGNLKIYSNISGPVSNFIQHRREINAKMKTTDITVLSPNTAANDIKSDFSAMKDKKYLHIICLLTSFNGINNGHKNSHISVGIFRKVNDPGALTECV